MKCPYCNGENWDYNVRKDNVIEPLDEGYIEYCFAYCPDCDKEFVTKDVYEAVEMGVVMTMEEFEKESE